MVDKNDSLEEKVATREHIIHDQGGSSYCSHCDYNLGPDPLKEYKICPGCNYTLTEGKIDILPGGSDF